MVVEVTRNSSYNFKDWWPETKILPDLIPGIGFITLGERARRKTRLSFREYYSGMLNKTHLISMGTENWPKPDSRAANFRANLMATRNVSMAFYHGVSLGFIIDRLLGVI